MDFLSVMARLATLAVAAIHLYILALEMFWWETPRGRGAFGTTAEFAAKSRVLAANQGLYNGFLAAGLLWGVWLGAEGRSITQFFLGCVIVAGLFGAATASRRILYVQAAPAGVALILTLLS